MVNSWSGWRLSSSLGPWVSNVTVWVAILSSPLGEGDRMNLYCRCSHGWSADCGLHALGWHKEHMVRVARDFVRVEWSHWTPEVVLDAGVCTCPGCFEASCPGPVEATLDRTASLRQELSVSFLVGFQKGSLTRPAEACRAQWGRKRVRMWFKKFKNGLKSWQDVFN